MSHTAANDDRPPLPELLTVAQFARRTPCSTLTIYRMVKRGLLEHFRYGTGAGRIFIPSTELYKFPPPMKGNP